MLGPPRGKREQAHRGRSLAPVGSLPHLPTRSHSKANARIALPMVASEPSLPTLHGRKRVAISAGRILEPSAAKAVDTTARKVVSASRISELSLPKALQEQRRRERRRMQALEQAEPVVVLSKSRRALLRKWARAVRTLLLRLRILRLNPDFPLMLADPSVNIAALLSQQGRSQLIGSRSIATPGLSGPRRSSFVRHGHVEIQEPQFHFGLGGKKRAEVPKNLLRSGSRRVLQYNGCLVSDFSAFLKLEDNSEDDPEAQRSRVNVPLAEFDWL